MYDIGHWDLKHKANILSPSSLSNIFGTSSIEAKNLKRPLHKILYCIQSRINDINSRDEEDDEHELHGLCLFDHSCSCSVRNSSIA